MEECDLIKSGQTFGLELHAVNCGLLVRAGKAICKGLLESKSQAGLSNIINVQ